ncbi:unnamed protein product [Ceratitis capitata]|uniref:(Mediterranean fruit fly) hypothetical protein n=1 Tax=Ceratitis capitata TaxID=7213 RepID=A0A811UDG2_CERCA|nr:unnamed protein product [Ceratitis capitata]
MQRWPFTLLQQHCSPANLLLSSSCVRLYSVTFQSLTGMSAAAAFGAINNSYSSCRLRCELVGRFAFSFLCHIFPTIAIYQMLKYFAAIIHFFQAIFFHTKNKATNLDIRT